jgi:hypothetical protein
VPARPARRACQHAAGDCFVGGCKGDMVQPWCVCSVFFYFSRISKVENVFYEEIWRNCGAFAPYFFAFWLARCIALHKNR